MVSSGSQSVLKKRVLTAIVLMSIVLLGIYKLSSVQFATVSGAFILLGAWEWSLFCNLKHVVSRLCYVALIALLFISAYYIMTPIFSLTVLAVSVIWWSLMLCCIIAYQHNKSCEYDNLSVYGPIIYGVIGLLLFVPMWLSLIILKNAQGPSFADNYLLFLFLLVWGSDTAAYFAGRVWGQHKLANNISPGKTWEGVYAALACGFIVSGLVYFFGLISWQKSGWLLAMLSICIVVAAIIGDLFESMIKRRKGFKDSSQLLPGHGGILDRIDSLTASAPFFSFALLLIN